MLTRLIIILAVAIPSWYFSDMSSSSRVEAYLLPILTFASILAFCLWVIDLFEHINTGHDKHPGSLKLS